MVTSKEMQEFFTREIDCRPNVFPITDMIVSRTLVTIRKYISVKNVALWKVNEICNRFGFMLCGDRILLCEIVKRRDFI